MQVEDDNVVIETNTPKLGHYGFINDNADSITQDIDIGQHHGKIQVHGDNAQRISRFIIAALNICPSVTEENNNLQSNLEYVRIQAEKISHANDRLKAENEAYRAALEKISSGTIMQDKGVADYGHDELIQEIYKICRKALQAKEKAV
jgi:hypothetical protein